MQQQSTPCIWRTPQTPLRRGVEIHFGADIADEDVSLPVGTGRPPGSHSLLDLDQLSCVTLSLAALDGQPWPVYRAKQPSALRRSPRWGAQAAQETAERLRAKGDWSGVKAWEAVAAELAPPDKRE